MVKFLIGVGCGIGLGLLVAPAPGEQTREQLLRIAKDPAEAARRKVQDVREDIAEMGAELGRKVAEKAADKVIPEALNQPPSKRQA